jgi:hypothetical protein
MNNRLRDALIEIANKVDAEWYPTTSLLSGSTLPAEVRAQMTAASEESPTQKQRCNEALAEFDKVVADGELAALAKSKAQESAAALKQLLRDKVPQDAAKMPLFQLVETAYDEIVEAADLNYSEDPHGQNYCNAWWCFAEIASQPEFQHDIFFAEADQVGYKRSRRHPAGAPQPNDLFAADEAGHIVINAENPRNILDALRKANVFSE